MSPFLKKSLNSAKCKTLLQITAQKLKILQVKHANAIKSARTHVATLLEKRQDSNAQLEVDSVYREQKIVALYNLLEQFCLLLGSQSESMKSQRECPLDLKEAVASLIYASSKCGEIEELKTISSYLSRKFGSEFSVAAKELRPGCGVNIQVIENLSSVPLSLDARIKLLKDIASEKKVDWDYDASKQPAEPFNILPQSAIGTDDTNSSNFERQNPSSMSVLVDDIGEQSIEPSKRALISPSRQKLASSCQSVPTSVSDPYALAKSLGMLDYKFVSDYMGSETSIEESSIPTTSLNSEDPSRAFESSIVTPNSLMSTAARQEMEGQQLDLETVTRVVYESTTAAAKAAGVIFSMVQNIKKPEGSHSESSSKPRFDDSSFGQVMLKPAFSPSKHKAGLGAAVNAFGPEENEDFRSKYEVSEQKSGKQQRSTSMQSAEGHIPILEGRELKPEAKPMSSSGSIGTSDKQLEARRESRHGKTEEFLVETSLQQDKSMQSLHQSDESSSGEEDMPYFSKKTTSRHEEGEDVFTVTEIQKNKDIGNEFGKPQFDEDSDETCEEEIPFYMKGRVAKASKDFDDELAQVSSRKQGPARRASYLDTRHRDLIPSLEVNSRTEDFSDPERQDPSIPVAPSASSQLSRVKVSMESDTSSWREKSSSHTTPFSPSAVPCETDPGLPPSNLSHPMKAKYMAMSTRTLRSPRR